MKKGMLFEAVVVMLLILLSFTLYLMVTTGPSSGPDRGQFPAWSLRPIDRFIAGIP